MSSATLAANTRRTFNRNLANALTLLRLALTVPIAVLLIRGSDRDLVLAASLLGACALTDFLDGRVARRWCGVSHFGCFLDPLADKCVIDSCIAVLTFNHAFPVALAALFVGRDLIVTVLRLTRSTQATMLTPSPIARLKTCALYLGIGWLILARAAGGQIPLAPWLLVASAALLSVLSAGQYLQRAISSLPIDRTG